MAQQNLDNSGELAISTTSEGIRYGRLGGHPRNPAPTLFVFAGGIETSLTHPIYSQACRILKQKGALCVSLDLPSHGEDIRPGEPEGLKGWRYRVDQGEDPMKDLVIQASAVLDSLIAEGLTDPKHVLASGTSRGGYAALRLTAHDQRVGAVAAFAPVTDLRALSEFEGLKGNPSNRPPGTDRIRRPAGRTQPLADYRRSRQSGRHPAHRRSGPGGIEEGCAEDAGDASRVPCGTIRGTPASGRVLSASGRMAAGSGGDRVESL